MKLRTLLFLICFALPAFGQRSGAPPASQAEVNAGLITSKYVSPLTLAGWSGGGGGSARALTTNAPNNSLYLYWPTNNAELWLSNTNRTNSPLTFKIGNTRSDDHGYLAWNSSHATSYDGSGNVIPSGELLLYSQYQIAIGAGQNRNLLYKPGIQLGYSGGTHDWLFLNDDSYPWEFDGTNYPYGNSKMLMFKSSYRRNDGSILGNGDYNANWGFGIRQETVTTNGDPELAIYSWFPRPAGTVTWPWPYQDGTNTTWTASYKVAKFRTNALVMTPGTAISNAYLPNATSSGATATNFSVVSSSTPSWAQFPTEWWTAGSDYDGPGTTANHQHEWRLKFPRWAQQSSDWANFNVPLSALAYNDGVVLSLGGNAVDSTPAATRIDFYNAPSTSSGGTYMGSLDGTGLYLSGVIKAQSVSGGMATFATNKTQSVTTTGITNNLSVNIQVLGFTGTSVTFYDNQKIAATSVSMGTITSPQNITLQPGGALVGTSCAASGTHAW